MTFAQRNSTDTTLGLMKLLVQSFQYFNAKLFVNMKTRKCEYTKLQGPHIQCKYTIILKYI